MKKILIMTALLTSGVILSGCGDTKPEIDTTNINTTNTSPTEQELLETPEVIETASGEIITVTGTNTISSQIKAMIEQRKEEMKTETGNEKELNEKDIEFLESILAKIAQKK